MDWLDLLEVQGTLKSLLQHHSSKASILQHSIFFIVQLSHPYMTTGKTIALTRRTFVDIDEITEAKSSHTTDCSETVSWGSSPPEPDAGTWLTQTHHGPSQAAVPLVPARISRPPWAAWAQTCVYDRINLPVTCTACTRPWKAGCDLLRPQNWAVWWAVVSQTHTHTHTHTQVWENDSHLPRESRYYLQPMGFPGGSDSKDSAWNVGDLGWSPMLGGSPGRRTWQPTQ